MNADSKYVVQGSLFPSKATHQVQNYSVLHLPFFPIIRVYFLGYTRLLQIVLENTIDGATRKLGDKWLVVDIDEWLQGNRFWETEDSTETA